MLDDFVLDCDELVTTLLTIELLPITTRMKNSASEDRRKNCFSCLGDFIFIVWL